MFRKPEEDIPSDKVEDKSVQKYEDRNMDPGPGPRGEGIITHFQVFDPIIVMHNKGENNPFPRHLFESRVNDLLSRTQRDYFARTPGDN